MEVLAGGASVIAVVQIADRIISLCGKYTQAVAGARDDIDRLINEVRALRNVLHDAGSSPMVAEAIKQCESGLANLEQNLEPGGGRKAMSKFGLRALKWPLKSKAVDTIIESLERRKSSLLLALSVKATNRDQSAVLAQLPYAENARFDAELESVAPFCLQNTRVDILRSVQDWIDDESSKSVFWLHGMAGSGKSTISRTAARDLKKRDILGASFFFSRGKEDLSTLRKFATTIALQLCSSIPALTKHMVTALEQNQEILRQNAHEQWRHLVLEPLSRLSNPQNIFIVLDALDECNGKGTDQELRVVLQLISELVNLSSVNIKIFITSRPEMSIKNMFSSAALNGLFHQTSLHATDVETVNRDIDLYLKTEFGLFCQDNGVDMGWPQVEDMRLLEDQANGLFIYAATVIRFMRTSKIMSLTARLSKLLENRATKLSPTGHLDKVYGEVLRVGLLGDENPEEVEDFIHQFKDIFGPLLALYDPLSPLSLSKLLKVEHELALSILKIVPSLVLVQEERPITLLHPSFRDYLFDGQRCTDAGLHIQSTEAHKFLAMSCIRCMCENLKVDICKVKHPGIKTSALSSARLSSAVPAYLRYACRYWVAHLDDENIQDLSLEIVYFFKNRLLQWIEVLALLGWISDGIKMIAQLHRVLSVGASFNSETDVSLNRKIRPAITSALLSIKEYVADTRHLLCIFRGGIEEAPLQVYSLAIIFSPENSLIRKTYQNMHSDVFLNRPIFKPKWDRMLFSLEGRANRVKCAAFSADSKLLATGACDGVCILWDLNTGTMVFCLESHAREITALVFDNDITLITASRDETIKFWNIDTGQLEATMDTVSGYVSGLFLAPTFGHLVSSFIDDAPRVWSTESRTMIATLGGHQQVQCCFASLGNDYAACLDDQKTLQIWNLKDYSIVRNFEQMFHLQASCRFDTEDYFSTKSIVFWNQNEQVLYDVDFQFDSKGPASALSPTRKLALVQFPENTYIWSLESSSCIYKFVNQYGDQVVCSSDGDMMANYGYNNHVSIWQWDDRTFGSNLDSVKASLTVFSEDLSMVALSLDNGELEIWCAKTASLNQRLLGCSSDVTLLQFSNDNHSLISVEERRLLKIWSLEDEHITFQHYFDASPQTGSGILHVSLSESGKFLAVSGVDTMMEIWDIKSGSIHIKLEHRENYLATHFSPNGRWLALKTRGDEEENGIVELWDLETRTVVFEMSSRHYLKRAVFSADCKYLALTESTRLRVLELETQKQVLGFEGWSFYHSTFSADSKYLAAQTFDRNLHVFSIQKGSPLFRITMGSIFEKFHFSSDGKSLLSYRGKITLEPTLEDESNESLQLFREFYLLDNYLWLRGEPFLCIPAEYRDDLKALPGNRLALIKSNQFEVLQVSIPDQSMLEREDWSTWIAAEDNNDLGVE